MNFHWSFNRVKNSLKSITIHSRFSQKVDIDSSHEWKQYTANPSTVSVILPTRPSFYTGHPDFVETITFLDDIYHSIAPSILSKQSIMASNYEYTLSEPRYPNLYAFLIQDRSKRQSNQTDLIFTDSEQKLFDDIKKFKTKEQFESILDLKITDKQYSFLLFKLLRLSSLSQAIEKSHSLKQFLSGFLKESIPKIQIQSKNSSQTIGKRKTAVCQTWIFPAKPSQELRPILINGKPAHYYFLRYKDILSAYLPFDVTNTYGQYHVWCTVNGGGPTGKAQAVCHSISKALSQLQPDLAIKLGSLLVRDSRMVERKKAGQPKARKKFTWVKR